MGDEPDRAVVVGAVGLMAFVAGSILMRTPRIDVPIRDAVAAHAARPPRVLGGVVLSPAGAVLLLWPIALQADIGGPLLALAATVKVATVVVEVAGTPARSGWNAGGRAAGSSGDATVAWLFALLVSITELSPSAVARPGGDGFEHSVRFSRFVDLSIT